MKPALLCLALVFVSSMASAQALWRDVPAGSTPSEVSQRIPEAQPADPATRAQTPQALLEIPGIEIAGGDFAVRFLFEDERLQSVVLRADTGSPEAARALARRIYTSLRARYGLELSSTSRGAGPPSLAMDRRWLFRRTTVRLQEVDGNSVVVTYGVQPERRSNAL
jgi:hypothetical protein